MEWYDSLFRLLYSNGSLGIWTDLDALKLETPKLRSESMLNHVQHPHKVERLKDSPIVEGIPPTLGVVEKSL